MNITEGIREAVDSKFAKVQSHYPDLGDLSMALIVERHVQSVDSLKAPLSPYTPKLRTCTRLSPAPPKKLDAALAKRKGTTKSHRHEKPEFMTEPDQTRDA